MQVDVNVRRNAPLDVQEREVIVAERALQPWSRRYRTWTRLKPREDSDVTQLGCSMSLGKEPGHAGNGDEPKRWRGWFRESHGGLKHLKIN